jgi:hypothetical protein
MFRSLLQVAVAANIVIKRFLVFLQRLTVYLQKTNLTVYPFFASFKNLMGFLLSHLNFELLSRLIEMPIKLHRLISHFAKHCLSSENAERAYRAFSWTAFNFHAEKMVWEVAAGTFKGMTILHSSFPLADTLDKLIICKTNCRFC